tara:strand:- start:177659 stop:178039 length:381 start_codon:yes stop_codon:yes gene_type:complete
MDKESEQVLAQMGKVPDINVEVAYALPDKQYLIPLTVKQGSSALAAVLASGITTQCPELDIKQAKMGIFSKALDGKLMPTPDKYELQDKDRVEIYRPLLIDPKQARKQRAEKARQEQQKKKALKKG